MKNSPCIAAASAASAAATAFGWYRSSGACRQTYLRLSPSSRCTSWIAPDAFEQNPHWKSPYSTSVYGASTGPNTWSRAGSTGRSSVVPASFAGCTRSATLKITAASRNATTDADSTPTRAWFCTAGSSIARSTMNRAIVKPMPHSAPPPASRSSVRPGPRSPIRSARMTAPEPSTPTNFPTTRPTTMPQVTAEPAAAARISALICTPALASANSGRMT